MSDTLTVEGQAVKEQDLDYVHLYSVVHDLRAPIRSIENYLEIMEWDGIRSEHTEKIKTVLDHMKIIIAGLRRLAESKAEDLEHGPINMNTVWQRVLDIVGTQFKGELESNYLPTVKGNSIHLTRVFQNLLDNAIKYGGRRIKLHWDEDALELRFSDNGKGVAPNQLEKIFEPLYRAGKSEDSSGVGLAIVKELLMQHGVTIHASTQGGGITFIMGGWRLCSA